MKTAITVWNNRVSPVFDVAGQVLLFDTQGETVCAERLIALPACCASEKVASLVDAGTEVLVCGAISRDAHAAATASGITVYPFIAGNVRDVLNACLNGRLKEAVFAMPGCGCRNRCPANGNQVRRRGRMTGSAPFCNHKPD